MADVKITYACLDGVSGDEQGMGIELIACLSNGTTICILLDSKAHEPLFREVIQDFMKNIQIEPETDGERVYWPNGASMSIQDVWAIAQSEPRTA